MSWVGDNSFDGEVGMNQVRGSFFYDEVWG